MTKTLKDQFKESAKTSLARYRDFVERLSIVPQVQQVFAKADSAIKGGRSMDEIAMDDAMDLFEKVVADVEFSKIPADVYHEMMVLRQGGGVTADDAEKQLKSRIQAIKTGTHTKKSDLPDLLKIYEEGLPVEALNQYLQVWQGLTNMLGQVMHNDAAIKAQTVADKVQRSLGQHVQKLNQRRMQEQSGMQQSPAQGGAQKPGPQTGQQLPATQGLDPKLARMLDGYGEDLTAAARQKQLMKTSGRDKELRQIVATLLEKGNSYPLMVGADGVGKRFVAEALAQNIVDENVPEELKKARLVRLDLRKVKAGGGLQKGGVDAVTGEQVAVEPFSSNVLEMLQAVEAHNAKGGEQIILHIDGVGEVFGRMASITSSVKDVLASAMTNSKHLKILGEMSEIQAHQMRSEAPGLVKEFTQVKVDELDEENTLGILKECAAQCTKDYDVSVSENDLKDVIRFSTRHMPQEKLPMKAMDLLKSAVAVARRENVKALGQSHLVEVVSNQTRIPPEFIGTTLSDRIASLDTELPNRVFGQGEALQEIVGALDLANTNMHEPDEPIGSFLMVGPTGVGKTETAKSLAECMFGTEDALITVDMANYQDQHAKAKLIGSPPGYVGFDKESALEKVREMPNAVILFDEIDKAHPDVQNLMLSILDEGRLQLMNGEILDFRNCVILMSSNFGAKEAEASRNKSEIGFGGETGGEGAAKDTYLKTLNDRLTPEFRNRLTNVLFYKPLEMDSIRSIAVNQIAKVSRRLNEGYPNLTLKLSDTAMEQIAELGYDPAFGARPLKRAIKTHLQQPLAQWMKKNAVNDNQETELFVKDVKNFDMEARQVPPKAAAAPKPMSP